MKSDQASDKPKRPKREVQVVSCPSAFPISDKKKTPMNRKRPRDSEQPSNPSKKKQDAPKLLDWHETTKEIRAYGATAFVGQQKRNYQDEQYFQLTGRHLKKQKVPLPIVRGIRKAAAKRNAKLREEAQKAGVVLPKTSQEEKKKAADSTYRSHGPAPSIGFMKHGVYRVNSDKKSNGGGGVRGGKSRR